MNKKYKKVMTNKDDDLYWVKHVLNDLYSEGKIEYTEYVSLYRSLLS